MQMQPITMEIAVLPADWEETVDYYSQVLNLTPNPKTDDKAVFHASGYDLCLINLGPDNATLTAEKFPPTYFRVRDVAMVEAIYKGVLQEIPGAKHAQMTTILAYPYPTNGTLEARTITMASVVIEPKSTCQAQVKMTLGVIHNPPYDV